MSSNYKSVCDVIPSPRDSLASASCSRTTVYSPVRMKGPVSKTNKSTDKVIGFCVTVSHTHKHNTIFNTASQNYWSNHHSPLSSYLPVNW